MDKNRYDHRVIDGVLDPLGCDQVTDVSAAVGLPSPPATAKQVLIIVTGQQCRYRDDGTDPTATVGMPIPVNTPFWYNGDLSAIKIIQESASAVLNVAYYR